MPGQHVHQRFDEIVNAYYERVLRGALSVTGDKHLAEEIVQETFLAAFRKFESFSGKSSVFTWLYAIMLNKFREHCRSSRQLKRMRFVITEADPAQALKGDSGDRSPYAQLAHSEMSELLIEAVYKLPIKLRTVVAMHYFDDLTLNEVAQILGCRLATVKSRLFRSKKRLRQSLLGRLS
jgi:RNA polymerase sigma-70 factor (ECF subfamily)